MGSAAVIKKNESTLFGWCCAKTCSHGLEQRCQTQILPSPHQFSEPLKCQNQKLFIYNIYILHGRHYICLSIDFNQHFNPVSPPTLFSCVCSMWVDYVSAMNSRYYWPGVKGSSIQYYCLQICPAQIKWSSVSFFNMSLSTLTIHNTKALFSVDLNSHNIYPCIF